VPVIVAWSSWRWSPAARRHRRPAAPTAAARGAPTRTPPTPR